MKNVELLRFPGQLPLADSAATQWIERLRDPQAFGKPFHVALSGGRIAATLFSSATRLAQSQLRILDPVHFFWADERCVPPSDPESNYGLANELLLRPLEIASGRIHRLRGEMEPVLAVDQANAEMRQILDSKTGEMPVLDLVLLGMGEDGHVASLFPGAPADFAGSDEPYRLVENAPKPPPRRMSVNYGLIEAARDVWVLVSGAGKHDAFLRALDGDEGIPLGRILKMRALTRIFSDVDS